MLICNLPMCQTTAGCKCGRLWGDTRLGHADPVRMGCICPGDATPYCRNPLCPRKAPPSPFADVRHTLSAIRLDGET
jgi:hypothetical protein